MNYHVEVKDIEPIRIAFMRYKGNVTEANKVFPNVFKAIRGKSNGAPFFCYHVMDQQTKFAELDLCVPTFEIPNGNGIGIKEMPRVKALCVTHIGSYETLSHAYSAIENYAKEHSLSLQPLFREVYIKGPGILLKGNPEKYITEVIFPLKED
ncbi:transcriptional regulator [Clostridium tetani]|uniref:AraC family transcriptional regulator n=1 Tax=Clostridium tetani TaxID=1513 RepID=A0ABY0ENH2_CLOTA|nr:GyrI-like domain-containing protein [Clostridium tetani]KHO38553.1 transcriptional regulator [Clostridium tetani]RXI54933.1 AraC family transcriptional regulator [Clostridium tetani]RXI71746.1 AraC family transcriptional regulator [Clostridium tetani]